MIVNTRADVISALLGAALLSKVTLKCDWCVIVILKYLVRGCMMQKWAQILSSVIASLSFPKLV